MKKKHVFWMVTLLTCLYMLACILLLRQMDKSRASVDQNGISMGFLQQMFVPRCECKLITQDRHIHGSSLALALRQSAHIDQEMCMFINHDVTKNSPDIQMYDVLQNMPISYPQYVYTHTGWIQQFDIKYATCQWKEELLRVIVVLHSHNDPGWLKTYDNYYLQSTKLILDKVVAFLKDDPKLKFVWAEMTYLARWYEEASASTQKTFKLMLQRGQVEVVTGGWVMSDEAVTHYGAILDQLIEGHQWLKDTFNYTVKAGWAIDPFGHSSTMAYLLQKSGIGNMLIQRTHFAVKKYLGYKKQLEFYWTQNWDWLSTYPIFCHMMPFLSYDIRYSCGPDINTCCNYDFHKSKCWKWGKYQKAEAITEENIKEKAEALLHQYRMKSQLFDHNVLLVPHGDDFRYGSTSEWKAQTENLKKLFDYMNKRFDMRVKVQFGTLSDYFQAVEHSRSLQVPSCVARSQYFPKLSGDFFTYNDRDDQYWSGYFTSRPFLKSAVRHLQSNLRATEILYMLTRAYRWKQNGAAGVDALPHNLYQHLTESRKLHGVLQHHDAITGTAKRAVVSDYLNMIHRSQTELAEIMGFCVVALLQSGDDNITIQQEHYPLLLELNPSATTVVQPKTILIHEPPAKWTVLIFNPLAKVQEELGSVHVSHPWVAVYDSHGSALSCQVSPVLDPHGIILDNQYLVSFPVKLDALSINQYVIQHTPEGASCPLAKIQLLNAKHNHKLRSLFDVEWESWSTFTIENSLLSVSFCPCTGLMQSVTHKGEGVNHRAEVRFVTYGTGDWKNPWRDKSGAYVFLPSGPAKELVYEKPVMSVVEGPLFSSVTTYLPMVMQKVTLVNITGNLAAAVLVENLVDLGTNNNTELAFRVITDVRNDDEFFTDLNGFQVHKRKTQNRLPIQGNVYPMTTMTYLQDDYTRISLLSAQSHGVSSLYRGWLEVMLDRRLAQDDWRGLNEGVMDNLPTLSSFRLLVETRRPGNTVPQVPVPIGFPSILAHSLSLNLNNPLRLFQQSENLKLSKLPFEPLNAPLPCDIHLVNLRSLGGQGQDAEEDGVQGLMVLHRLGSDCDFKDTYTGCLFNSGRVRWTQMFSQVQIKGIEEVTLTGAASKGRPHHSSISLIPMDMNTYKVTFR